MHRHRPAVGKDSILRNSAHFRSQTLPRPIMAIPKPTQQSERIRAMFAEIAPRYDLLNHLLSANVDILWRRMAADLVLAHPKVKRVLDVACGTGDMALEIARRRPALQVVGADFTGPMVQRAAQKSGARGGSARRILWLEADGLQLPFPDGSFDAATIAFGIRNMESLDAGLREMGRVLRPGGLLVILECTPPESAFNRFVMQPYFLHVLPRIGALLSQRQAYLYLPHSVMHFPSRRALAKKLQHCGYRRVRHRLLHFGMAALHAAEWRGRPSPE